MTTATGMDARDDARRLLDLADCDARLLQRSTVKDGMGHRLETQRAAIGALKASIASRKRIASGRRSTRGEAAQVLEDLRRDEQSCTEMVHDFEVELRRVESLRAQLAAEVRDLEAQRAHVMGGLSPRVSAAYAALVEAGRVPAIARCADGLCRGCGLRVPGTLLDEVRRSGVVVCPGCQRLLCASRSADRAAE